MEEKQIIEHLKNGDEFIYKYVYDQYSRMVYSVCFRMTGNKEEAEDVTQDVFIKLFNSINYFHEDSKLSTWIYQITVNTSLNRLRRKKVINFLSLNFWEDEKGEKEMAVDNITPETNLEKSEIQQIVQEAINSLPAKQKTAIILSRYEELSYKEISKVMELGVSAVESLIFRAKENLAKKLIHLKENYY
ncbi:MAG: sigma-70 family RNA polymerase sigma factor [Ignavibacteria bacterium]|nr:sigma-70 family RNA polymerase sigma factor [Ignavibacteria bacterium]MDP3830531.1 sigma-70 family RNA polymerase sigma factor [Ignavibacteriaceae bacterium]